MSRSPFRVAIARGFDVSARNSRGMLICSTSASVNMRSRNRPISPDVHPPSTHPFGKSRNSIYHDRLFSIFFPRHHTRQRARVIDSREVGSEKSESGPIGKYDGRARFFFPPRSLARFFSRRRARRLFVARERGLFARRRLLRPSDRLLRALLSVCLSLSLCARVRFFRADRERSYFGRDRSLLAESLVRE